MVCLGQAYISSKREGDFFHRFLSHFFETKREILPNFFFITLNHAWNLLSPCPTCG